MIAIIVLTITSIFCLFLGFTKHRAIILPLSILALIIAFWSYWTNQNLWNEYTRGMLEFNSYSKNFLLLLCGTSIFIFPLLHELYERGTEELADFIGIILLSIIGGFLMVSYTNMMTLFLGIEILSIAMYVLAGANRRSVTSNEASIKYFILGAFASAILLFGIALFYVSTGSLSIQDSTIHQPMLYQFSLLVLFSAFAFKVALAPFHFWVADVYQGTPTLFTIIMATIVKISGFGAMCIFILAQAENIPNWIYWFFSMIALASMLLGNIFAYGQSSVKRILAFSGVVQSGFFFLGLLQLKIDSTWILLFYLIVYVCATIITFGVTYFIEQESGSDHIDNFAGLSKSNPIAATAMTIALISLAGIPLTGGFISKLYVLKNCSSSGNFVLIIVALILAVVSFYYYFKIINAIFSPSGDKKWALHPLYTIVLSVLALLILTMGILPSPVTTLLK